MPDSKLSKYRKKRKFDKTPEPSGHGKKTELSAAGRQRQLKFVVQKHHATQLHYDFRLESEGVLLSWAVPKGPSLNPDDKRLAMMVEDHPYDYREFEGTIPEGNYGAGTVMVWDQGNYIAMGASSRTESEKLVRAGLHKGHITFILNGEKLKGEFALIKLKRGAENAWLLVKADDQYASKKDILKQDHSAKTGRTMQQIAKNGDSKWQSNRKSKNTSGSKKIFLEAENDQKTDLNSAPKAAFPKHPIRPMLAKLVSEPFDNPEWYFEIKWDGFRTIAEIQSGGIKLYSRNNISFDNLFAPIAQSLKKFKHQAIFDGEVVVLNSKGVSEFQLLQNYQNSGKGKLTYCVFDILHLDGRDLRGLPLEQRKAILKNCLPDLPGILYSDHVQGKGISFFKAARKQGLEGILAKDKNSKYLEGKRADAWQKIKIHMQQEAVIGGFTAPRGSRKDFGALILGVYNRSGGLEYIGHTGGGFNEKSLQQTLKLLRPIEQKNSPFNSKFKTNAPAKWVQPKYVAEIAFQGWTDDGHMRQPIFMGMRPDKKAKDVSREIANGGQSPKKSAGAEPSSKSNSDSAQPEFSHLDKIFWPDQKYTKGDLIEYYRSASDFMLPYLKDRPESLNRHPNGIKGKSFFQKDFAYQPPAGIKTKLIHSESENKNINYLLCQDQRTLLYMANLGCIEINPWNSRIQNMDKPDWLVIDLDPEEISFDYVVQVAQQLKKVLDSAGAKAFCKTSGATGLHIYVPLGAKYDYEKAKEFAHLIALLVNKRLPEITSVERSPKKRKHKVYLDFLQNRKGQTLAAPYSVRPRPGATVSTPLKWSEVKKGLDPKKFTIKNTLARLKKSGDLWAGVLGSGIDLRKCLKKLSS